jgi:ribosomal-protein-alanine N-acetyltransferase
MITEMTREDLACAAAIERDLFPDHPWSEADLCYELEENPYAQFLALKKDGKLIGYADLWIMFDQAQIANIAVAKEYQKMGYGQILMDEMTRRSIAAECENITLEVRVSNSPAIALYEKNGFIKAAVRKGYYDNGEDAWLMIRPIGGLEV